MARRDRGELLNLYGMSEAFCACMMTPPGTSDGVRTGKPFPIAECAWGRRGRPASPVACCGCVTPRRRGATPTCPRRRRASFATAGSARGIFFVRDADGFYIHQGTDRRAGQGRRPMGLARGARAGCARRRRGGGRGVRSPTAKVCSGSRSSSRRAATEDAARAAALACEGPPRHKRPKWIRTVAELPRTATGKVQRYKLREILERELERSG